MKVLCLLLVLVAILGFSQSLSLNRQSHLRYNGRLPVYQRRRLANSPFIVGGEATTIAQHPHHLGLLDLSWGGYICGASIISRLFALSAAHCLEFGVIPQLINLWGGSTSRIHGGVTFLVDQYVLHPQYNDWTLDFDIAALRVNTQTPLEGHLHVTPIALAPSCAAACCTVCVAGDPIIVAGWGADNSGGLPEMLLQVSKPIHDRISCNSIWRGSITSRMFCTVVEEGRDSCNGDSGGAIVRNGVQVGVVSFGDEICGHGRLPAVYVRIEEPAVRQFILGFSGV